MSLSATKVFFRGTTIQFVTEFFDVNGVSAQPNSATINIAYADPSGDETAQIAMAPVGGGSTAWSALFDTRGLLAPRMIYWSIHTGTGDPAPVAVEDGCFQITANPANLPTF